MYPLRRVLSLGWLILAVVLFVSELTDIHVEFWKPSWLFAGLAAVAVAFSCWAAMFFNIRRMRLVGIAGATAYFLYWLYLFSISPPEGFSQYLVTGVAVMVLAVLTIAALLFVEKAPG